MASITSTGLGSGLNINNLVEQLVNAERTPKESRFDAREALIQTKISSLGNFKGAISTFQTSLSGLKSASSFQKMTVSSSDTTMVTASAEKNADVGNYRLDVKQLAQSHALASSVYTSADAEVGTGKLTIQLGTTTYDQQNDVYSGFVANPAKTALSLTIDGSNNTLTGLRDAINNANAGVNASIINDGSGYRLVLDSKDTGAANSMQISVTDDGDSDNSDNAGLSAFSFNATQTHLQQNQAAQNANISINGLAVSSASNTITSAVKGLTINLLQAQAGKVVNLNVSRNQDGIKQSVESFIKGFNELKTTIDSLSGYDLTQQKAGVMLGDSMLRGAMSSIRNQLTQYISGLNGSIKSLSDIGISFQRDGSLSFEASKLTTALSSKPNEVAQLFTALGSTDSTKASYLSHSNDTQPGSYSIEVTRVASAALISSSAWTAGTVIVDSSNDNFKINVDGKQSGFITLSAGTYTGETLAAEIQSKIDADTAIKQGSVKVSFNLADAKLEIKSLSVGVASSLSLSASDSAMQTTIGLSNASAQGESMQASIGGTSATMTGFEALVEKGPAKGLKVLVEENTIGAKGSVSFSRGLMGQLDRFLNALLTGSGSIKERTDTLQKDLLSIDKSRKELSLRMDQLQKRLFTQFNSLDSLMGRFQSTSSFLTQQLGNLPLSGSNKS